VTGELAQHLAAKTTVSLADLLAAREVELVPRLAFEPEEAAEAIGVSRSFFLEHVIGELRVVRRGRKRIIPRRELERWLEENAERVLE
jgi:excisionase family DNA binding protein